MTELEVRLGLTAHRDSLEPSAVRLDDPDSGTGSTPGIGTTSRGIAVDDQVQNPLETAPEEFVLGETSDEVQLDSLELIRLAVQRLLEQTHARFYILDHDLDRDIFGTREFCEAMAHLCRIGGRHTDVRILIATDRKLVHETHRLLDVIRQFAGHIHLRIVPRRFADLEQTYVLADDSGVLLRRHHDPHLHHASVSFHSPHQNVEMREEFKRLWEHSDADPNVRELNA
jgi:hypothetical protein